MLEQRWWHPVAALHELGDIPLAVTLLGEELVLWRDAAGAVHAFDDRCPHRGTKLSLGRVQIAGGSARLECAYHGWQFAGDGRCVHIPAVPAFVPTAAHSVCAHAVREAHGLLWVRPASVADAPLETALDECLIYLLNSTTNFIVASVVAAAGSASGRMSPKTTIW